VTVPVGSEVPEAALTVAVKATVCPAAALVGAIVRLVEVPIPAPVMARVTALEVDGLKLATPAYDAVTEYEPTARLLSWSVATPCALRVPVPRDVVPL
jgi:hypothetical protein